MSKPKKSLSRTKKDVLIVLVKYPRLGQAKTRLITPALNDENVCHVCELFLVDLLKRFTLRKELRIIILGARGDTEDEFCGLLEKYGVTGKNIEVFLPGTGSLEGDMAKGYEHALQKSKKAILTAPDIPYLPVETVNGLREALNTHDFVFCPNIDGTALPHGMKKAVDLFSGKTTRSIDWLRQLFRRIKEENLSYRMFPPIFDIDRFEDLVMFYNWQLFLEDSGESELLCPETLEFLKSIMPNA